MGNRAIITTRAHEMGVYLHWYGGRDAIEPLLKYCELQGWRPPNRDCYGWARLCQVLGNFFSDGLSVGVDRYERLPWACDNGIYVIEDWRIVGREGIADDFKEQDRHDYNDMLHAFDKAMPRSCQLGEKLDAVEIPPKQHQTE